MAKKKVVKKKKIATKTTSKPKAKRKFPPASFKEVEERVARETRAEEIRKIIIHENAASKKYPTPNMNPVFHAKWNEFISNVADRENFKAGHLSQLEILCDMYVEYESLKAWIREHGYTYETFSATGGRQVKTYPQVVECRALKSEIRNYTKTLGLILVKDTKTKPPETPEDKWE